MLERGAQSLRRDRRTFVRKALRYPRLYRSALSAKRRIAEDCAGHPTLEEDLAYVEQFRWEGGTTRPTQVRGEILWLLTQLAQEPPRVVLEIGSEHGGTLFLWTRVAARDALIVSVDRQQSVLGAWSPHAVLFRCFARAGQKVVPLQPVDSHDPATVARVERLLAGRKLDFLFIDGDHSYDGTRLDFELYSPLVRTGGIVAFHDVSPNASAETEGTARYWSELKERHVTHELVAGDGPAFGIGIVRMPAAAR